MVQITNWYLVRGKLVQGKDVHPSLTMNPRISGDCMVVRFDLDIERPEKEKFLKCMYGRMFYINPISDRSYCVIPKDIRKPNSLAIIIPNRGS